MRVVRYTLLFLAVLPFLSKAQTAQINLQLKWWHQFQFAGYYAAQFKDFYKEEGLQVNIYPGTATTFPVQQVTQGKMDFAITGSDLLQEYVQGAPVVVVAPIFQHSPYVIIAPENKKIYSPSDLIGKTIMAAENQGWVEMRAVLLKEGIDLNRIKVINHTWRNADLISGKVDAMTAYRSVEIYQLEKAGIKTTFITPITYGIDFYGDVLFTSKDFVQRHPELTEKFKRATLKGWDYAMKHRAETADYILTLPGVKERGVTKEALLNEAEKMNDLILPELVEIGHSNAGRWEHIAETYKSLGLISKNVNLKDFVYTPRPSWQQFVTGVGLYVLIGIALLFLIISVYSVIVSKAVQRKTKELKEEYEARKESEKRYSTLIEQASDGIVIGDQTTRFIDANSAALKMFGYTKEEFLQMSLPNVLVMEPDAPPLRVEDLKSGKSVLMERKARRKDGSTFILEISSKMLPDGMFLGFGRDITEKKLVEDRIRKHEHELNLIYNTVGDVLFMLQVREDGELYFYSINSSFSRTTGLQPEQILNKNVKDVIPEPSLQVVLEHYKTAIAEKKSVSWEETTSYPSGVKTGIVTVTPVFDEQGNCNQLIGSVHDVTETKTAERELVKMNERFEHVTHATFDVIWDWDLTTDKLYWGGNLSKVFGHIPMHDKDTINDSFSHLHPDDRDRVLKGLNEAIIGDSSGWNDQYRYAKADDSYAYVNDKAVILRDNKGKAIRMIGAMQDITQQVMFEQERANLIAELTKTNNELKQFSFITSHNIRAPLTNLIAITQLIDPNLISDPGTRELIEGFTQSTHILNETLNDLLKILIIKNNVNQTLNNVEFSKVYERSSASVRSLIENAHATIVVDFKEAPSVQFNEVYLESIFLNLITNAIKYAHKDRHPILHIRTYREDDHVMLSFADNGSGLNMEKAKGRIFGLYQKFHSHPDSKGIGLYLVHSQLTSLGGSIEVNSEENKGTEFIIRFPAS